LEFKKLLAPLVALVVIALALTALTAAVLNTQQNIPASGTIQTVTDSGGEGGGGGNVGTINLDVYTDAAATIRCTSIEWGALSPGDLASRTVYLKNSGNTAEVLNMTGVEWNPSPAGSVLTLSWNKEGTTLAAGAVMAATVSLYVPQETGSLTSFSLNIVISGSAQ
jgi:hypothetical protein